MYGVMKASEYRILEDLKVTDVSTADNNIKSSGDDDLSWYRKGNRAERRKDIRTFKIYRAIHGTKQHL